MKIEQLYTGCLAQGAYYIESKGEVAIIDPLREVWSYLDKAKEDNAKIKYVFETHFHADFVSGHLTLAKKSGAEIIYGPTADPSFEATIAKDGEVFKLGDIEIVALHTPGHTMESTTYLLKDEKGRNKAIFTGDTLFLGDVGRPDLAQKTANITQEELAGILYDSLRQKIMPLDDDVIVYPAHGAGSACGKNMMKETIDTLGNQKKVNYALREDMSKEEFIQEVTDGLLPPPEYFPSNVRMNKEGYVDVDEVLSEVRALGPDEFEALANQTDALIIDVNHYRDFVKGHIPKSIFIGLDGGFAPWVGTLIRDVNQKLLIVTPENRVKETITRLSRVGFDQTLGYLKGGFAAWKNAHKEYDTLNCISAEEFAEKNNANLQVFDVRKKSEFNTAHLEGAKNTPLTDINDFLDDFKEGEECFLHCKGGYRSVIAASILKSRGIHNLTNINGGFDQLSCCEGLKIV